MEESTWEVAGMTCEHCVASVTEEIREIDAVTGVAVELAAGRGISTVTVTSSRPLAEAAVRAAVEEAGYRLAG